MQTLLHQRNLMMMYSPNNCLDTQWCYIASHEVSRKLGEAQGEEAQEKSLVVK
jgi:hypothetical protein